MNDSRSDILIIGAGIAGLVLAHECLEAGLSVHMVDRDSEENVGGLARWAFGGMALVDTPLQRRMGIKDSPELAMRDWESFADFGPDDSWPRRWARKYVEECTDSVFHWLKEKDMKFFPAVNWVERGDFSPGNSVPRYHLLWGAGHWLVQRFVELLKEHSRANRLRWTFAHRVDDLLISSGRVVGCECIDEASGERLEFHGNQVVVATGGINGNLQKVRDNWHQPWGQAPTEMLNGAHPFADGRMHDAVLAHGGKVTHLDWMWNYAAGIPHPQPLFDLHGLSLVPCKSALWLDHSGERIGPQPLVTGFDTNELCRRVSQLEKPWTWHLLNWRIAAKEFAISGAEHNPHFRDRRLLPFLKETLLGNHRLVRQMEEECDHFLVAKNLPDLVEKMNVLNPDDPVVLEKIEKAVTDYDEVIRRGEAQWNDDQLRRIQHARSWRSDRIRTCKPKPMLDEKSGPLIAIKLRLITRKSLGGIQTDLQSRVLNNAGQAIDGLYAIGEAAGFGGGGASGFRSLEGTFLSGCILTARAAADDIKRNRG